jgi:tetratricopeptide (TPR) repeat protein
MLWILLLAASAAPAQKPVEFELEGRIRPAGRASVTLYGATSPFAASTLAGPDGRFRFRKLLAGAYTVAVFMPGRGEARETIDIGPSLAGRKRRVSITLDLKETQFVEDRRRHTVSARELAIPERARREYLEAQKLLSKRDVPGAMARLERAVELAPQFVAAWNNLGTIAYQSRDYATAEKHFRRALSEDPAAYEPLVNLGGALLSLRNPDDALPFNLHAVLSRPNDALANAQLGMNYFALGKLDLAEKYLIAARQLDPGHFSHPQLTLAEVYLRRKLYGQAAGELEDFLRRHPDWAGAAKMRDAIAALRAREN